MVTANWFVTATEARNNVVKDIAVHGEISALEMEVLLAVQRGDYQVTVDGESPMTVPPATAGQVFTVDAITNTLEIINHGFEQGQVVTVSSTQQLPSPLQPLTFYYVIYVDDNHIKLAATKTDAQLNRPISINIAPGVGYVTVTDPGSGYVTAPQVSFTGGNPSEPAQALSHLSTRGPLESVTVLDGGFGFTYSPTATVVSPGSGAQAGAVRMKVVSILGIVFGGSNYNVGDTLTLVTGGGLPAASMKVTQVNAGSVTQVSLLNPGNYLSTQLPVLTSSITTGSGAGSGCSLNLSMGILSIVLDSGGLSYAQPPQVSISGGGGADAQAQAVLTGGVVTSLLILNPGTGYTGTPTVDITSGAGATVSVQLSPTQVARVDLVNNGGNYFVDVPSVQFTTPGSGATVNQVFMKVVSVDIRSFGQNYQVGDQVYVSGGVGTQNTVLQVASITPGGGINTVQIVNGGSYTTLPALQNNPVYGGSGINAYVDLNMGLDQITILNPGSAYQVPPYVVITGTNESPAIANSRIISGSVTQVDVVNPGTGYTQIPTVALTCGSGATATAILVPTGVKYVDIINPGSGYVDPPLVTLVGGGGVGATAEATLSGDQISFITVTYAGSGYTSPPQAVIEGNAQAQSSLVPTALERIDLGTGGSYYVMAPTVVIDGPAQALSVLQTTFVTHVTVTNGGADYASDPVLSWQIGIEETGNPTLPTVRTQRSFAVSEIVVTYSGDDYQSVPDVSLSAPLSTGVQALAEATLSVGQGIFYVQAYTASQDYWKVNCGLTPSSSLLVRPYKDQIASVIKYFEDLGYSIVLETNPATGNTLQWTLRW